MAGSRLTPLLGARNARAEKMTLAVTMAWQHAETHSLARFAP